MKYAEIKEMIFQAKKFVDLMEDCELVFEDGDVKDSYEEFKIALEHLFEG